MRPLTNDGDQHFVHLVPPDIPKMNEESASKIHDNDKCRLLLKYKSGATHCLEGAWALNQQRTGLLRQPDSQTRLKTRLLYLIIKILSDRPPASCHSSQSNQATKAKAQYKRIVDRVLDDPVLCALNLPFPHTNKSITISIKNEERKTTNKATVI